MGISTPERAIPSTDSIVTIGPGAIRGVRTGGVHAFLGIPYAAPPFGPGRLRPPRPVPPWTGIRDATAFGPEPPQPRLPADPMHLVWDPAIQGEDCLNLNIWTPDPAATSLPVMVWIPGGMFEVGTGATYDGSRFARDGVVCVTINYRVGPEGFLYLAGDGANLGLLDQVAALEFVRDHIRAFGGDPGNVTIFGESAGAMSVGTLMAMPRAEGLFRRAIAQSGAADRVIPAATAERIARDLAAGLGIPATRSGFETIPPAGLVAAAAELKSRLLSDPDPARWGLEVVASMLPWQPVVDGDVIPSLPIERIRAGAGATVELIVGTNVDDWRLFVIANGSMDRLTDDILAGPVATHGIDSARTYGVSDDMLQGYRRAHPGAAPGELLAAIETDWWCRIPAMRLADAHSSAHSTTWMYEFGWPSPAFGGMFGACHGLELAFVFDTLDRGPDQMLGGLLGDAPPQALADAMHRAWVAFARVGDPGWPAYNLERRATMRFDSDSGIVDDPRSAERALWAAAG